MKSNSHLALSCLKCENPRTGYKSRLCLEHQTAKISRHKLLNGLCSTCGRVPAVSGKACCIGCGDRAKTRTERIRNERMTLGQCIYCGIVSKQRSCESCKIKYNKSRVLAKINLRIEVMNAYGGVLCTCCGENRYPMLTIDHVNNDGAKQRKSLGTRTASKFLYWLKSNGYPIGYQVMCWNCNCGRAMNGGVCPHKDAQWD